jgi:glucosylceramidase
MEIMHMKWIATSSTASWHEKVPQPTEASPQLFVTDHRQQVIDGFGGCFNEIGWQALQSLSEVFTLLHHYLSNGVNGFVY